MFKAQWDSHPFFSFGLLKYNEFPVFPSESPCPGHLTLPHQPLTHSPSRKVAYATDHLVAVLLSQYQYCFHNTSMLSQYHIAFTIPPICTICALKIRPNSRGTRSNLTTRNNPIGHPYTWHQQPHLHVQVQPPISCVCVEPMVTLGSLFRNTNIN